MEVLDCIRTRRSIRKFLEKEVSLDLIGQILEAGKMAPNAGNIQNLKFVLVREAGTIKQIAEACLQQYWMEGAPVHIIIVAEPQRARQYYGERGEKLYTIQNCAAACENMLLAAHSLGLGACWVSAFDTERLRNAIGAPNYVEPQIVFTLGYPDEKASLPIKYKITDITYLRKWGAKIYDLGWVNMDYSPTIEAKVTQEVQKLDKKAKALVEKIQKKSKEIHSKIKDAHSKYKKNH